MLLILCLLPLALAQDTHIVDGGNAALGQFPWLGVLYSGYPGDEINLQAPIGGCALIHPQYCLSAASELSDSRQYTVVFGMHDKAGSQGRREDYIPAEKIQHANYDRLSSRWNMGLLRFSSPVNVNNPYISTVALSSGDGSRPSQTCYIAGHGLGCGIGCGASSLPQFGRMTVLSDSQCSSQVESYDPFHNVCAEDLPNKKITACLGDFGGPLTCMEGSRPVLVGNMAFAGNSYFCLPDRPVVSTRVSSFRNWICTNTRGAVC